MERHALRRLTWAAVLAIALVAGAIALPSYAKDHRRGSLHSQTTTQKKRVLEALPHVDPPGTPPHNHNDPATKNDLSRAAETGAETRDPTSAAQKIASAAYVAAERRTRDPRLTTVPVLPKRLAHPQNRYAMANG